MALVIFDMDETLISSLSIWAAAPARLLKVKEIPGGEELEELFHKEGLTKVIEHLKNHYGLSESEKEIFDELSALCEKSYADCTTLKEDASYCVFSLRKRGHRTCVLSANSQRLVDITRSVFSTSLPMDGWFSAKTLGVGKSDCHVYDLISGFFGLPISSCILVDDASYAVETAVKAGIKAIHIDDGTKLRDIVPMIEEMHQ